MEETHLEREDRDPVAVEANLLEECQVPDLERQLYNVVIVEAQRHERGALLAQFSGHLFDFVLRHPQLGEARHCQAQTNRHLLDVVEVAD